MGWWVMGGGRVKEDTFPWGSFGQLAQVVDARPQVKHFIRIVGSYIGPAFCNRMRVFGPTRDGEKFRFRVQLKLFENFWRSEKG